MTWDVQQGQDHLQDPQDHPHHHPVVYHHHHHHPQVEQVLLLDQHQDREDPMVLYKRRDQHHTQLEEDLDLDPQGTRHKQHLQWGFQEENATGRSRLPNRNVL